MKKIFFIAFTVLCFSLVNAQHKNEGNKPVPPPPPPVPSHIIPVDLPDVPQPPLPPDAALVVVEVPAPSSPPLPTEKDHLMVEPPAPPPHLQKKPSKIRSAKQNQTGIISAKKEVSNNDNS